MVLTRPTRDTLWTLIVAPTVWALHFLASYVVAAIACARATALFAPIDGVRLTIAGLTAVALLVIGATGLRAWREWHAAEVETPHDRPTAEHRERLLEFATVLLAALSFVGVLFVALSALVLTDCR